MKSTLSLILVLAATWAALSAHYSLKPLIFGFGVLSIALVVVLYNRLLRVAGAEPIHHQVLALGWRLPRFSLHLAWLVIKANLRIAQLLLDPRVHTAPRVLRMKVGTKTDLGHYFLANSITLTPGTVTLDLRNGEVLVHAIGPVSAETVVNGEIDTMVQRLEGNG